MKIGIMTYFYGANYGAKAQAYALFKTLESFGHSCSIIDYRVKDYFKLNLAMNFNVRHKKQHPILLAHCLSRTLKFQKTNSIYTLTSRVSSGSEIDNIGLDCIVFGSDAIFNVKHKSFNKLYMGVGIRKTRKVSYAPSCENLSVDFQLDDDCKESLMDFRALSVRDINTQELLLKNIGRKAQIVCDPTLLYDFDDIISSWNEDKYILLYCFSPWDSLSQAIKSFAEKKGLKIISIGRYCRWADKNYDSASFSEWICSFKNAEYVITDSFHGTAFALKNNKQTVFCSREDKRDKIQSLLNDCGVQRSFYDGTESVECYLNNSVMNYNEINKRLASLRDESLRFLKNSLDKER